jgi:hypothetical protein
LGFSQTIPVERSEALERIWRKSSEDSNALGIQIADGFLGRYSS